MDNCTHKEVRFEEDRDKSGWVRAVCIDCYKKGNWRLNKIGALATLTIDDEENHEV